MKDAVMHSKQNQMTMVYRLVSDQTKIDHLTLPKTFYHRLPERVDIPGLPDEPVEVLGIYCADALSRLMRDLGSEARSLLYPDKVHAWCSTLGIDGKTGYGRYRYVSRLEFEHRPCIIYMADYKPSFHWLDVLHDPCGCREVTTKPVI